MFGSIAALLLLACAVPLAPGYRIERESLEVNYAVASSGAAAALPHLEIRATYWLKNIGNSELTRIEAALPSPQDWGRRNLRVQVDGLEVVADGADDSRPGTLGIPFDPPWLQKKRREVVIEYTLAPEPPGHSVVAVNEDSFHLREFGWFPELRAPKQLLAKGGERPGEIRVAVRVPEGYRVLSSGRDAGARKQEGAVEHRFRVRPEDFEPFVVAGRYEEQRFDVASGQVIFWTFERLVPDQVQRAAARLGATLASYRTAFGPEAKKPSAVWLVETRARLGRGPAGNGFPDGALLNREAFAAGLGSEDFLSLAEHELAHTWFGNLVVARPEAELLLGEALATYATMVAAEARGGEAERRRLAAEWFSRYEEARSKTKEKPLGSLTPADPWEQRVFAYSKGALFFVALEDRYGKENVRRGLTHLIGSLRGSTAGLAELRSALELETHQNLAEFFRTWLDETGIPAEFRARYAARLESQKATAENRK